MAHVLYCILSSWDTVIGEETNPRVASHVEPNEGGWSWEVEFATRFADLIVISCAVQYCTVQYEIQYLRNPQ